MEGMFIERPVSFPYAKEMTKRTDNDFHMVLARVDWRHQKLNEERACVLDSTEPL